MNLFTPYSFRKAGCPQNRSRGHCQSNALGLFCPHVAKHFLSSVACRRDRLDRGVRAAVCGCRSQRARTRDPRHLGGPSTERSSRPPPCPPPYRPGGGNSDRIRRHRTNLQREMRRVLLRHVLRRMLRRIPSDKLGNAATRAHGSAKVERQGRSPARQPQRRGSAPPSPILRLK